MLIVIAGKDNFQKVAHGFCTEVKLATGDNLKIFYRILVNLDSVFEASLAGEKLIPEVAATHVFSPPRSSCLLSEGWQQGLPGWLVC